MNPSLHLASTSYDLPHTVDTALSILILSRVVVEEMLHYCCMVDSTLEVVYYEGK